MDGRQRGAGAGAGPLKALALLLAAALIAPPAHAAPRLTKAQARAFAQKQEAAWNARDLDGYFALFTKDAVFVDQTRDIKNGGMIPYGRSSVAQARAQAAKFLAGATSTERGVVDKVEIAADGRSARLTGREVTTIQSQGRTRRACADTEQTLVLVGGEIRSKGQTDTITRCR
ncbi:DUF4440 domain-containing protein [Phenylobacterium sp.]|uniref:DUF4440 domain-containing protein n=1 Tax=Phenylobacterium sp. TaxID=1871053 RepID=UPI00289D3212|nr:DUF4440 domain-containing protein [Phenylobacterium sp.]